MEQQLLNLLKDIIGVVIIFVTPYLIAALKAAQAKAIAIAGKNNYDFAKTFIEDIIKARPDVFSEEEVVKLVDEIDDKLGDKLTHDEVEQIVKSVFVDLQKQIAPVAVAQAVETK